VESGSETGGWVACIHVGVCGGVRTCEESISVRMTLTPCLITLRTHNTIEVPVLRSTVRLRTTTEASGTALWSQHLQAVWHRQVD